MRTTSAEWTREVASAYAVMLRNRRLYRGEHGAVFLTNGKEVPFELIIPNLLGEGMTDIRADLVFCEPPRILPAPPNSTQEPDVAYQEQIAALVQEIGLRGDLLSATERARSHTGYGDWKMVTDPLRNTMRIRLWGARDGEFTTWEEDPTNPGFSRAVNFWSMLEVVDPKNSGAKIKYRVRERHELTRQGDRGQGEEYAPNGFYDENGQVIRDGPTGNPIGQLGDLVTYAAWRMDGAGGEKAVEWAEVRAFYPAPGPEAVKFLAGADMLPGYRADNLDLEGDGTGDSDYTPSRRNLQWNVTLISSARGFATAITTVPQITVSEDCLEDDGHGGQRINWGKFAFRVNSPDPNASGSPIEIKNWIGHLGESDKVLAELLEFFDRESPISPVLLGRSIGSDQSGTSIRLSLLRTERAVNRWRQAYDGAFLWALQYASMMKRMGNMEAPEIDSISVEWAPAIPEDPTVTNQLLTTAKNDGCMSVETYIRLFHQNRWTDTQVEIEMEKIAKEKEDAADLARESFAAPNGGNPFAIQPIPPLAGDRSEEDDSAEGAVA